MNDDDDLWWHQISEEQRRLHEEFREECKRENQESEARLQARLSAWKEFHQWMASDEDRQ